MRYEIVGSEDRRHLRAGTGVHYDKSLQGALDPKRVAAYFAAYTGAGKDKDYQHQAPEGWTNDNGSTGRYWGNRGVNNPVADPNRKQAQPIHRHLHQLFTPTGAWLPT